MKWDVHLACHHAQMVQVEAESADEAMDMVAKTHACACSDGHSVYVDWACMSEESPSLQGDVPHSG